MMRRVAVVVLSVVLTASSASANREWLPCNLRTPEGGGIVQVTGGVTDRLLLTPTGSGAPPASASTSRAQTDRVQAAEAIEQQVTFRRVAPRFDEGSFFIETRYITADFDRFEGTDIAPVHVRAVTLGFGQKVDARWSWHGVVPHYDVTEGGVGVSGVGDVPLGFDWRFTDECARSASCWWGELHGGVTLPTGDEEDDLGFGAPAVRVGVSAHVAEKDHRANPPWHFGTGILYGYQFESSDASSLGTFATFEGALWNGNGSAAFLYAIGAATSWELSDEVDRPGLPVRDDRHQTDLMVELGGAFFQERFEIRAGCRVALDDDGLRDELIPTVSAVFRIGR